MDCKIPTVLWSLWQGDFSLWASDSDIEREKLYNMKQKTPWYNRRTERNINYKSTQGQRSALLLEDKFGLKQEKEWGEDTGRLSG